MLRSYADRIIHEITQVEHMVATLSDSTCAEWATSKLLVGLAAAKAATLYLREHGEEEEE